MGRLKRTPTIFGDPDYIRIDQLMYKLSCGEDMARVIGDKAEAKRDVDGYVVYDYCRIKRYIDTCAVV